jgi:hypothetical protein
MGQTGTGLFFRRDRNATAKSASESVTSKRDRHFSPKISTADNTDSADMKTGVGGSQRKKPILPQRARRFSRGTRGKCGLGVLGWRTIAKRDRHFSPKRSTADNTDSADMKTGVGGSWRESAEEADFTTKGTKIFTRDTRKVRIGCVGLGDNCKKGQALFPEEVNRR